MAERYFPFASGPGASGTESDWGSMVRAQLTTGVIRAQSGDSAKGVVGQECQVFADSTGMQVKVRVGEANVRGYYYINDAQLTLPITAAHATLARIDYVVLKLDLSARTIAAIVKAGTPGASPTAPGLVQSGSVWEMPLATIAVGAAVTTIAAGNVTDQRITACHPAGPQARLVFTMTGTAVDANPVGVNVTSISRTAAGQFVLGLRAGVVPNGNYVVVGTASGQAYVSQDGGNNSATSAYFFVNNAAGTPIDPARCAVAIVAGDVV